LVEPDDASLTAQVCEITLKAALISALKNFKQRNCGVTNHHAIWECFDS